MERLGSRTVYETHWMRLRDVVTSPFSIDAFEQMLRSGETRDGLTLDRLVAVPALTLS